jgi:hypothetical protein
MSDTTATLKPVRLRSEQDRRLADRISTYRTALVAVQTNADLAALLAARGYNERAIATGIGLCDTAMASFTARQNALGARREAAAAERTAEEATRNGFDSFRRVARGVFTADHDARKELGTTGAVPKDEEEFITVTSAAYATALGKSAYLERLSPHGYDQAGLEAEQARTSALTAAAAAHESAKAAAVQATATRDAAARALSMWWAEFRGVAQVVLKERPDLRKVLGV